MEVAPKLFDRGPRRRSGWYTGSEIATHCVPSDCWLSLLGMVYDVTNLLHSSPPELGETMLLRAGGDVSHWFDPVSKDARLILDPDSKILSYFTPQGRFIHIPPKGPRSDWDNSYLLPWWLDNQYLVGRLSRKTRFVCIKDPLIPSEVIIEVPSEETINEILERYLKVNSHATSYTWKAVISEGTREFMDIDMNKSLSDNGIKDYSDEYNRMGMAADHILPCIHVYFDDDLTIA